ncbi:MAG: DEAD/DEAH box helicase family protein [bacterium]|jgi:superfamily II DNA or RNA helicase
MNLKNFNFKTDYNKANDDIAEEFYIPCMDNSINYDRISGYFGSTIYIIAWKAIKNFIANSGKMRIICSPFIIEDDRKALQEGYSAHTVEEILITLKQEINELLDDNFLSKPSRALACFVAMGIVDIKIAILSSNAQPEAKRLFHDKVGIFKDNIGNTVGFRGSMNETFKGLSSDGNIESIDVFPNWIDERDKSRVENAVVYFDKLWNNSFDGIDVYGFPEAAKEVLTKYVNSDKWEELVEEVNFQIDLSKKWSAERRSEGRIPKPHQVLALEGWRKKNYRGIFEHATGSGKTFTAMCAIREAIEKHEIPIVLVPSKELLSQWHKELINVFNDQDLMILVCGDGNNQWKKPNYLSSWTQKSNTKRKLILTTIDTAASDQFLQGVVQGEHIFIVADEVHRLGSPYRRKIFTLNSGSRLGLSATPRRFGDEEGTTAIFNYFGDIIPPPFTLKDAIKSGVLTKYFYYPHEIKLNPNEQDEWNDITDKISRLIAQKVTSEKGISDIIKDSYISNLLIQRARIIKNASAKIDLARQVLTQCYLPGQRWLIYCDNQKQLKNILEEIKRLGYDAYEYHSAMLGDRSETLKYFSINGGILVSIKCLDEGVDIPAATHALILASSKNSREFIQRRGRILRLADRKPFAVLHDAIVTPYFIEESFSKQTSIIESELARAVQFGEWAENPASITKLKNIAIEFGIDFIEALNGGYEDDQE